jgi:hypothetical protein
MSFRFRLSLVLGGLHGRRCIEEHLRHAGEHRARVVDEPRGTERGVVELPHNAVGPVRRSVVERGQRLDQRVRWVQGKGLGRRRRELPVEVWGKRGDAEVSDVTGGPSPDLLYNNNNKKTPRLPKLLGSPWIHVLALCGTVHRKHATHAGRRRVRVADDRRGRRQVVGHGNVGHALAERRPHTREEGRLGFRRGLGTGIFPRGVAVRAGGTSSAVES